MFLLTRFSVLVLAALLVFCCINFSQLPCCGAEGDDSKTNNELVEHPAAAIGAPIDKYSEVLRAYKRDLNRKIKRSWFPPKDGSHAVVSFSLNRRGEVSNLAIYQSSGSMASDESALNAVKLAQPFRAIPMELPAPLDAKFDFQFYVNEYSFRMVPGVSLRSR